MPVIPVAQSFQIAVCLLQGVADSCRFALTWRAGNVLESGSLPHGGGEVSRVFATDVVVAQQQMAANLLTHVLPYLQHMQLTLPLGGRAVRSR
jgi:hypothetical protein